jgi:uncharacterized repeat protein (TIGR02543 family)/LPXTG-motif cell wall-anchored protein
VWAALLSATVFVACGILLGASPAHAATVNDTQDGMSFSADDANIPAGATVTAYDSSTSSQGVTPSIPSTVAIGANTYSVTTVDDFAFQNQSLTSVTIPTSVTTINSSAFEGNFLSTVSIPQGVASISSGAFSYNSLNTVSIPDSVLNIASEAFDHNQLTTVVIPDSVTSIAQYAFSNNLLSSVTIGNSVASIGQEAFEGNHLTTVTIPDSVTSIGNAAFNSNHLTTVTLGAMVDSIGNNAFANNQLTSIAIPGSVTTFGYAVFDHNPGFVDAVFLGPAPTAINAGGDSYSSLGSVIGLTVHYSSAFEVAGGFTSPTWQSYDSERNPIVSFDLGGHGAAIAPEDVGFGLPVAAPTAPTASGWTFNGWFTDASHTIPANFSNAITIDTTVYARWVAVPALAATGTTIPVLPIAALAALALLAGVILRKRTRVGAR